MKLRAKLALAGVASVALAGGIVLSGPGAAFATAPGWEPDANSVGSVTFYDATGNQITSGSTSDAPMAAYYVASGNGVDPSDNKAYVAFATPQQGVDPASWTTVETFSATTAYPNASAPNSIKNLSNAVVTGAAGDGNFADHITAFPNNSTTAGYQDLYQVRVYTTHSGGAGNAGYYSTDIMVSGGTWTQVYPAAATATTTSLSASPSTTTTVGAPVELTATLSPTAAAGTVQFKDGSANLGSPVAVDTGNGEAVLDTSSLTHGSHSLTAVYTPTDANVYAASTSTALPYSITYAAPAFIPAMVGNIGVGYTVSCIAGMSNATTTTYAWLNNGSPIGGATAATYTVADALYHHQLSCKVTGTNVDNPPLVGTSAAALIGVGRALVPAAKPYLSGAHAHGQYETANHGTWSPAATSYTYQWYVGTTKISGATSYHFLVPSSDIGKVLYCVVTAKRLYWTNGVYKTAGVKVTS